MNDGLDCDMRGVFDTLAHAWCVKGLPPRVADPRVLRLIQTGLRAGGAEEGQGSETTVGVPQGRWCHRSWRTSTGPMSSIWGMPRRKRIAQGDVVAVRVADDRVLGVEPRADAARFLAA